MLKIEWSPTIPAQHMVARLGQHFLINKERLRDIANTVSAQEHEIIIEIGPGHGELTQEIFKSTNLQNKKGDLKNFSYIAIEKDETFIKKLKDLKYVNFEVLQGDALRILPALVARLTQEKKIYKIIGNIPYYITGKLLRIIGELSHKPISVVFTIQREVAERICAEAPHNNLLAASVVWWATPHIVDYIPKEDFSPQPMVESAVLHLTTKKLSAEETLYTSVYYKCIKILFRHPRKTILNNFCEGAHLTKEDSIQKLTACGINPHDRPQNLTSQNIFSLLTSKLFKAKDLFQLQ